MANKVVVSVLFESKFKRLVKKFPALQRELAQLLAELNHDHAIGEPLGGGLYKIRLASEDKGRGKSGGFRVITYTLTEFEKGKYLIYLVTIYDKSEESSIKKADLLKIIKSLFG
jgi:hypothetical protein